MRKRLSQLLHLPYLPVLLGPFILFSSTIVSGRALFWGTPSLQFVPWFYWSAKVLASGHLPLWNPLVGMGAPLIANYQSALFYPPNWIFLFLGWFGGAPLLAWGQAWLVALHLVFAGIGMIQLARRIGLNELSQAVCGIAFSLSGYLVARGSFLSIISTAAWLPWILEAGYRIGAEQNTRDGLVRLAIFSGLQFLAGHAQTSWYSIVLAIFWTGFWAWQTPVKISISGLPVEEPFRTKLSRSARATVFLFFGLGIAGLISAIQLFPTGEYLVQSQRASAVDYEFAMTYSFWPWRLLGLFVPDLFGNPIRGDYWGYASYWEDAVYIGLLPILMAGSVLFRRLGEVTRYKSPKLKNETESIFPPAIIDFLFAVVVISFILALGKNTPVFPWLYRNIPTFNMFQAPTRFALWGVFALTLLAGIGVGQLTRPAGRRLYWTRLAVAGGVAITLAALLAWVILKDIRPTFIRATALAGFLGTGVGVLSLLTPDRKQLNLRTRWQWVLVLFVLGDLLLMGWGVNPDVAVDFYRETSSNAVRILELAGEGRVYLSEEDEYALKFDRFLRFDDFRPQENWANLRAVLLPNLNLLDGIASVNNFDPLVPGRYQRWMDGLSMLDASTRQQLLNLMGVSVVEGLDPDARYGVTFQSRSFWPRWRWVPCAWVVQDGEKAWSRLIGDEMDLGSVILTETDQHPELEKCDPSAEGRVMLSKESPGELEFDVSSDAPGWLYLADTWYPGWRARVDANLVPVVRANYLHRAVSIPAGEHKVVFNYQPPVFRVGVLTSLLGWLFWVFLLSRYGFSTGE